MYFLISARVFPFTPNWLLNITSPWFGVPWRYFACSVLLGLLPYNFVSVRAGTVLMQLNSVSDAMDVSVMLQLAAIAAVAMAPVVVKRLTAKAD